MKLEILIIFMFFNESNQNKAVYQIQNNQIYITHFGYFNLSEPLKLLVIVFSPSEQIILNDSIILNGLEVDPIEIQFGIVFKNFKGFDLKTNSLTQIRLKNLQLFQILFKILDSNFDFWYENLPLSQNCNKTLVNNSHNPYFLFNSYGTSTFNTRFSKEICPLIFLNSYMKVLELNGLSQSPIKYNQFEFQNVTIDNLNSTVSELVLLLYHCRLSEKLLNKDVFKNLGAIDISGPIDTIEQDLFYSFKSLKLLRIKSQFIKNVIVRNNKWLKSLNTDVYIDMNKTYKLRDYADLIFILVLYQIYSGYSHYTYPDEDYCYFKDFPHEKLVFPVLAPDRISSCSCTELYLIVNSHRAYRYIEYYNGFHLGNYDDMQYYEDEIKQHFFKKCVNDSFDIFYKKCNFRLRMNNCDIKPVKLPLNKEFYVYFIDFYYASKYAYFLFFILNRILAFTCILLNIITVVVLNKSKNIPKENMKTYKYLILNNFFNMIYSVITFLALACDNELIVCSLDNPIYLRYFKLIILKFLGNSLKTSSNLAHLLFTFSRYVTMTSAKYRVFKKLDSLTIKKSTLLTFVFGLVLNGYICFEYTVNEQTNMDYKVSHVNALNFSNYYKPSNSYDYSQEFLKFDFILLNVFQNIRIVFSDTIYIILSLFIDLLLFFFVKNQMKKKEKILFVSIIDPEMNKRHMNLKRQARRSINRITSIIILNGINFLIFRFPLAVISFYGLIYYYDRTEMKYNPNVFGYIVCRSIRFCSKVVEFLQSFYYLSFIIQFLILLKLDKNFSESYDQFKKKILKRFVSEIVSQDSRNSNFQSLN